MAKIHPLEVVLFLTVVAVSRVQSIRTAITYPQVVEYGTVNAADTTCFEKKIYKGQPSPANFDFVAAKDINYGKAITTTKNSLGGVIATYTMPGATSVLFTITEAANKDFFLNDITVTLRCTA